MLSCLQPRLRRYKEPLWSSNDCGTACGSAWWNCPELFVSSSTNGPMMHHMRLLLQAVKLNLLKIEDQFCLASNGNMWDTVSKFLHSCPAQGGKYFGFI